MWKRVSLQLGANVCHLEARLGTAQTALMVGQPGLQEQRAPKPSRPHVRPQIIIFEPDKTGSAIFTISASFVCAYLTIWPIWWKKEKKKMLKDLYIVTLEMCRNISTFLFTVVQENSVAH